LNLNCIELVLTSALNFVRVTYSIGVRGHSDPVLDTLAPTRATCAGGHVLGAWAS
jgi:hypothetical protein